MRLRVRVLARALDILTRATERSTWQPILSFTGPVPSELEHGGIFCGASGRFEASCQVVHEQNMRRIAALLCQAGCEVNKKRVERILATGGAMQHLRPG